MKKIWLTFFGLFAIILASTVKMYAQPYVNLTVQNQKIAADTFYFDIYLQATTTSSIYLSNSDFVLSYNFANFSNSTFGFQANSTGLKTSTGATAVDYNNFMLTGIGSFYNANQLTVQLFANTDTTNFSSKVARIDNSAANKLGTFYITGMMDVTQNPELSWVYNTTRGLRTNIFSLNSTSPYKAVPAPVTPVDPAITTEPVTQSSGLTFSNITSSAMDLKITSKGSGANRLILAKKGSVIGNSIYPVDGIIYTANSAFGSGTEVGEDVFAVYNGTSDAVTISNLNASTTYYFAVYEYNGSGGETENYNTGAPLTGSETTQAAYITVNAKAYLQGPYNTSTGFMNTSLNAAKVIPTSHPYSGVPWSYSGTETVSASFFTNNPDIVDWVLVEVRQTPGNVIIARRACFLKKDGSLVDTSGSTSVRFYNLASDSYYIAIKHRNHLGVMSSSRMTLSASTPQYDFTSALSKAHSKGGVQMKASGGKYCIIAADADANGRVNLLDKNTHWRSQNGTTGYKTADYDLSGRVNVLDANIHYRTNNGSTTQIP